MLLEKPHKSAVKNNSCGCKQMNLKKAIDDGEKEIIVKGRYIDVATAFSLFDKECKYEFIKDVGACEFLYRLK